MSEKRRCGVLSFPGITRWNLQSKDTWQWFPQIKLAATFLAKMATQNIHRHARGGQDRVHRHQARYYLGRNRYLCNLKKMRAPKQNVCHKHVWTYVLRSPTHDFCQGLHARWSFYSWFADSWWSIHQLVHCLLRGNAADSHVDDKDSHLRESDSEDESWMKATGFLSTIIFYNSWTL